MRLSFHFLEALRLPTPSAKQKHDFRMKPTLELLEDRLVPSVSVDKSFAGLAFPESFEPTRPPDMQVAAGPTHVVEAVNSAIVFVNKATGVRESQQQLSDFFAPLEIIPPQTVIASLAVVVPVVAEPKLAFDEQAGRFVLIAMANDFVQQTSHLLVAVSDDANPNGTWEMHKINVEESGTWGDYPGFGLDADGIYVRLNMIRWSGGFPDHISLIAVDKSSVLDNNNATLTYRDTDHATSSKLNSYAQPAVMQHAKPGDPMFFVRDWYPDKTKITRMTDKLSDEPTLTEFLVPVDRFPSLYRAPQRGTTVPVNTHFLDIANAAWRDDRLVVTHAVGIPADKETHVRWYEFSTAGDTPTVIQQGTLDRGDGIHTYFPSIAQAPNGAIGITFMQSSSSEYVSMYVTGRTADDPPGTMQEPVLIKAGEAPLSGYYEGAGVWAGHYSSIAADPLGESSFWAANEYAAPPVVPIPHAVTTPGVPPVQGGTIVPRNPNWGTWIAKFAPSSTESLASSGPHHAANAFDGSISTRNVGFAYAAIRDSVDELESVIVILDQDTPFPLASGPLAAPSGTASYAALRSGDASLASLLDSDALKEAPVAAPGDPAKASRADTESTGNTRDNSEDGLIESTSDFVDVIPDDAEHSDHLIDDLFASETIADLLAY